MLGSVLKTMFPRPGESTGPAQSPVVDLVLEPQPQAGQRDTVVTFLGSTRSRALDGYLAAWGPMLERRGWKHRVVRGSNPGEFERMFADGLAGRFAFAYGFAGMGTELEGASPSGARSLWSLTRTPFLKLLGDHPSYFLDRHFDLSPYTINVYGYPEHRDFHRRMAPGRPSALMPLAAADPLPAHVIDGERKKRGKVLFLKNGNDPEALRLRWRDRLPPLVARALLELSERLVPSEARPVSCDDIERAAIEHVMERLGFDLESDLRMLSLYIAQLDDYVRRAKSTMIARALLDLPVEVRGELWSHVDFAGRRARLVPSGDYFVSRDLMKDALAVIDMTPNSDSGIHERFVRAASRYTLCITNDTRALRQQFPSATRAAFTFDPSSIRERVEWALSRPAEAVELGLEIGTQFAARHTEDDLGEFFAGVAEHYALLAHGNPMVQDFFVWPPARLHGGAA
jgi:hypothetical protein